MDDPAHRSPRRSRTARWRAALALCIGLVVVACSMPQLAYNHIDWWFARELARYVTLSDEQEQRYEATFAQLWRWHRRTELPAYAHDLRELADRAAQPVSEQQALEWMRHYVDLFTRTLREATPAACPLLATLDDEQVADAMRELERDVNRYARKNIKPGEEESRAESERKQLKSLRRWLGSVTREQRDIVHRWATQRPYLPPAWAEYRRAWRAEFGAALAMRTSPAFCPRVEVLMTEPERLWLPSLHEQFDANQAAWARMLAELSATLTPTQRDNLRDQLLQLARDLEQLSDNT